METAREQAQKIMKERTTKAVKRDKLLKIGLTENDVQTLFFAERMLKRQGLKAKAADRARRQYLSSYTFGVEIECYNARPDTIGIIATRHGFDFRHEGYNHTDYRSHYKLVSDSSIRGVDPIECVSPILNGSNEGFDSLKSCCDILNEAGARVNVSTGLHIHVGGSITEQQYCNTFVNYMYLENVINTFLAPSRRESRWCRPLSECKERLLSAHGKSDVRYALNNDRYHAVNAESYPRHQTIEFRQHQGSTNYEKIANWARFCIKLVHWSAVNRLTAPIESINEIEFLTTEEKAYFTSRANALAAL